MKMKLFSALAVTLVLTGEVEARELFMPGAKNCPSAYAQWQRRVSYRWSAFAVNTWNSTGQACGYTYRYSTRERALRGALKKCNREERATASGRRGTCRILGVK
jgi:hypothetical protein